MINIVIVLLLTFFGVPVVGIIIYEVIDVWKFFIDELAELIQQIRNKRGSTK